MVLVFILEARTLVYNFYVYFNNIFLFLRLWSFYIVATLHKFYLHLYSHTYEILCLLSAMNFVWHIFFIYCTLALRKWYLKSNPFKLVCNILVNWHFHQYFYSCIYRDCPFTGIAKTILIVVFRTLISLLLLFIYLFKGRILFPTFLLCHRWSICHHFQDIFY